MAELTDSEILRRDIEEREIEDTISDDERRRFIALDHAVRISDGSGDTGEILKAARAFEAYLREE